MGLSRRDRRVVARHDLQFIGDLRVDGISTWVCPCDDWALSYDPLEVILTNCRDHVDAAIFQHAFHECPTLLDRIMQSPHSPAFT